MKRFQIVEVTAQLNHAGTKATADVATVAERLGFRRIAVKMDTTEESIIGKIRRQFGYYRDWGRVEESIENESVVLLQHPFHYPQLTREMVLRKIKNKNVKVISFVHDVEELRGFRFNSYYEHEFNVMIELANIIIVHNDVMKEWFIKHGIEENRLISLEIFDYLQNSNIDKKVLFEKSITVAGNLDTAKCGYIGKLGELEDIKVHLYGPNVNKELLKSRNIEYHGSYPVDEIPQKLNRGFGLVWDGDSVDGCKGLSGQYLRYNNPHKLSLYLSSGLPVVIWKGAAEAKFVRENGVGLVVDSMLNLKDILANINSSYYRRLVENTNKIKYSLCDGSFAYRAITKALVNLEEKQ